MELAGRRGHRPCGQSHSVIKLAISGQVLTAAGEQVPVSASKPLHHYPAAAPAPRPAHHPARHDGQRVTL
jgi:hypothetical protein